MLWLNKVINPYPDILVSDCSVESIQIDKDTITLTFSEYGFFKRNHEKNRYYRTNGAQIIIEDGDIENLSIKEVRTHRLSEEIYFESMYEIKPKDFLNNINTGKWRMVIVEELYAVNGGFFIARVREKESSFWCHIKLQFKNLIYLWNDCR